ncbi:MAG: DUF998 domain-containing protein [Pseudonocardia sp.]|nr:DUF998 domain-containing protein [Pseudonocardia sp.]
MAVDRLARTCALAGAGGAAIAVVLILGLHVVATDVDPIRRTISEYGLGPYRSVFDVGVLALALGTLAVTVSAVRNGLVKALSVPTVLLVLFAIGMGTVVAFEKTNWAVGPSVGGYIHRYASLVAFMAMPAAAIAIGRRWKGDASWAGFAAWTRWLGVVAYLWFAWILGGFLLRPFTGRNWWQAIPLGLVERGLALTELLVVVVLAVWGVAAARQRVPAPLP